MCEELGASIYSFPMKYHPIEDPEYFDNRDFIGKHWNRKFIRTIQAILNSTKGKVGRGRDFFCKAFGSNEQEYFKLLYMPEAMIIYRFFFEGIGLTDEGHQGCPLHRLTTQLVAYTQKDAVQQERTMYKPIQGTGQ